MHRASEWSNLQEGSVKGIVKLWAISLWNPLALVLEYAKLGNLREYLRDCQSRENLLLHPFDLLEAAFHLATALFHMVNI